MRFVAVLLVLAGLGFAFGYPLYQLDYSGKEFARERVFDRNDGGWKNGWKPIQIEITESQNPVRIRLIGEILSGEYFMNNTLPLTVDLQGPEGKVLSSAVQMNSRENSDQSGASQRRIQISTTDFGIVANGTHTLTVAMQVDRDVSLNWMDAAFIANVQKPDYSYQPIGLSLTVMGVILFVIGSKRRRRAKMKAVANKPKPSRWGRRQ